jgi:hypothetical protein
MNATAKKYDLYDALLAGLRANPWKHTTWLTRVPAKPKPVKKTRPAYKR